VHQLVNKDFDSIKMRGRTVKNTMEMSKEYKKYNCAFVLTIGKPSIKGHSDGTQTAAPTMENICTLAVIQSLLSEVSSALQFSPASRLISRTVSGTDVRLFMTRTYLPRHENAQYFCITACLIILRSLYEHQPLTNSLHNT
jgi:hypothetical protein